MMVLESLLSNSYVIIKMLLFQKATSLAAIPEEKTGSDMPRS